MSTAPSNNPFPRTAGWLWLIVAFLVGVLLGQSLMAWTLKPDSFSFPTYQIVVPQPAPDV